MANDVCVLLLCCLFVCVFTVRLVLCTYAHTHAHTRGHTLAGEIIVAKCINLVSTNPFLASGSVGAIASIGTLFVSNFKVSFIPQEQSSYQLVSVQRDRDRETDRERGGGGGGREGEGDRQGEREREREGGGGGGEHRKVSLCR